MTKADSGIKIITTNRKASFNYALEERFEAGLQLTGTEVKSLRDGNANINDSYAIIRNEEAFLLNSHIPPYKLGNQFNHEPDRTRKLLMHKHEISKLLGKTETKGYSLIPTKLYFKKGRAKIEIALAKSKKKLDKREQIKKRQLDREAERAMKRHK